MMVYQPTDQEGWQGRFFVRAEQDPIHSGSGHHAHDSRDFRGTAPGRAGEHLKDIRTEVLTPDRLNGGCVRWIRRRGPPDFPW